MADGYAVFGRSRVAFIYAVSGHCWQSVWSQSCVGGTGLCICFFRRDLSDNMSKRSELVLLKEGMWS